MCYKKSNIKFPTQLGVLTQHHRRPRSKGGKTTEENMSFVPDKLHCAYHYLFANYHPYKIAEILNEHWIDTDYHMVAVPVEFLETIYSVLSKNKRR